MYQTKLTFDMHQVSLTTVWSDAEAFSFSALRTAQKKRERLRLMTVFICLFVCLFV